MTDDYVAHIPAVVWVAERPHADGTLVARFVNDAAASLLGYPADTWRSTPEFWIGIAHEDDRERALRHMRGVLDSGTDATALVRWTRADGTAVPMEVHLRAIRTGDGDVVGLRGFAVDVSRWEQLRLELASTRDRLAYAARLATLNDLVTSLVHEINQPLNAILNVAEAAGIVLRESDQAEAAVMLDEIVTAAERAGNIIKRARGLARKGETECQPVDLNAVAAEVCEILSSEAVLRNVSIGAELSPEPCMVSGDRVQLVQVLLNLACNALDAVSLRSAGAREVRLLVIDGNQGDVTAAVIDNGPGIPLATMSEVFEPLVSTKEDGLGLGLAVASSIVEAHGGRMWAGNNRDGGAHFVMALPATRNRSVQRRGSS